MPLDPSPVQASESVRVTDMLKQHDSKGDDTLVGDEDEEDGAVRFDTLYDDEQMSPLPLRLKESMSPSPLSPG